jgi:hypothetical protein
MKTRIYASLFALLGAVAVVRANADVIGYQYDWSGGDAIVILDAPSSGPGGGAYSQIFTADILGTEIYGSEEPSALDPGFTWTPFEITGMDLGFAAGYELDLGTLYPITGDAQAHVVYTLHREGQYDYYVAGSWLASGTVVVPDGGATGLLFGLALAGLAVVGIRKWLSS